MSVLSLQYKPEDYLMLFVREEKDMKSRDSDSSGQTEVTFIPI